MDIGVYLGHETTRDGAGVRAIARAADGSGYHSLWASEHVVVPLELRDSYQYTSSGTPEFRRDQSFSSCMSTLAHVAGVTSRVRLGTCVIPMIAHHPLALAKEAAVVDQLSEGRLELGIGAGWLLQEAALQGLPTDRPGARLEEAVRFMRRVWGPAPAEFDGEFWQLPPVFVRPEPAQGPDLPIWIGGSGPRRLSLVKEAGLRGVILASREYGKVASVREALPPGHRVGILVNLPSGPDPSMLRARLAKLAQAGTDLAILSFDVYDDSDASRVAHSLEHIAESVLSTGG